MPPKIKNPIAISIEQFLGNVLICGGSIIQIFTLVAWLIVQLQKAGVQVIVEDFRGFWRCLLNLSGDCAVFRSHEVPRNLLQPNGNRKEFASAITREIGKSCGMMPTTANACFSIIEGSYRSVRAGEPHLSFIEFQKKLRSLSQQWKNPKFDTAARSLEPLISLLGDCAYLKKAPDIFEQFGTIVFEHGRLPKQWYGLFAAHNYFSCQTGAALQDNKVKRVFVFPDGDEVFAKELSESSHSGYVPPFKRSLGSGAFHGIGHIVGAQFPSSLDPSILGQFKTVACFQCRNPKDARTVQPLQHLPEEMIGISATLLENEFILFSEGFSGPTRLSLEPFKFGNSSSDSDVADRMSPILSQLKTECVFSQQTEDENLPIEFENPIHKGNEVNPAHENVNETFRPNEFQEVREFLRVVAENPELGVSKLYKLAGLNSDKGNRLKNRLVESGLVTAEERRTSFTGRPSVVLALTNKAKELCL